MKDGANYNNYYLFHTNPTRFGFIIIIYSYKIIKI